jgi:lipoprotein-anchoring transpeptidase ErfK/SrfK
LVNNITWYRIGVARWVHGGWVRLLTASNDLPWADDDPLVYQAEATATMQLPVGWVVTASSNVRSEPSVNATIVGTVLHNQSLAILEERTVAGQKWYRIGAERWVYGPNVRVARLRARPSSIRANERWVGVNLREQTAVAYEGDKPVYAALVATGLSRTPTVQGIFRTWWRLISRRMAGGSPATGGYYYLEEVPWTMYFYSGYALHAAYWHDAFGNPRSHGCVNLSMYDAWWIFKWSEPGGANSPAVYVYWA